MAVITIIRKKTNLDFSGFQTMTLSCDKNGSMLVKEKKNGKPWNLSGKNVYICGDHFVTGTFYLHKNGLFP